MSVKRVPRLRAGFELRIELPGSKSIALRHILMSTLAEGPTALQRLPRCDDVDVMLDAVECLGVRVERRASDVLLSPAALDGRHRGRTTGAPRTQADDKGATEATAVELYLGMSGVSLRLTLAHAMLRRAPTYFTGHPQLEQRPCADLLDALEGVGCTVDSRDGFLPITIRREGRASARTRLRTDVTSQYASGLLLAAPGLPQGLEVQLVGKRASASYLALTTAEMARRGIDVAIDDDGTVRVPHGSYRGGQFHIEGDASAATYHAALATLHRGDVTLTNIGASTRQGDYAFLALCERMGAKVHRHETCVRIVGPQKLNGLGEVDMADMPDAAPTLYAMAPFLPTPTRLTGLGTLRVKECDRIACGAKELRRAGVRVDEGDDEMTVHPAEGLRRVEFDTHEDHRMAMSLSVLASRIGGRIRNPECVAKTYLDYWQDFKQYA